MDLGPDGRFGYKNLTEYWSELDHHPFLITVDGKLAGFVLVKKARNSQADDQVAEHSVWDMAEFFIVRAYRRHGIGLAAARQVWRQFSRGPWQVRVMRSCNGAALHFWQRAVDAFVGNTVASTSIERDGKTWAVFHLSELSTPQGLGQSRLIPAATSLCQMQAHCATMPLPLPRYRSLFTR